MAGDVTPEEIRRSDPELRSFDPGRSITETKQVAMSTRLRCIHERDNYPARIDELMQQRTRKEAAVAVLMDHKDEYYRQVLSEANDHLRKLEEMQGDASQRVEAIMAANQLRIQKLSQIERYKAQKQAEADASVREYNEQNADLQRHIDKLKMKVEHGLEQLDHSNKKLQELREVTVTAREHITKIRAEEPPVFGAVCCDKCGQELPNQEAEREKLIEKWRSLQRKKIEELTEDGNDAYQKGLALKAEIAEKEADIEDAKRQISKLEEKITVDRGYYPVDFSNDKVLQEMIDSIPPEQSVSDEITAQNNRILAQTNR